VQVEPGTYRIIKLSNYAGQMFNSLGIPKGCGDELTRSEVKRILDCYLRWLIAAATGDSLAFAEPLARLHQQVPFAVERPNEDRYVVTLSGGVGELAYTAIQGQPHATATAFGDLGVDLANRILEDSPWSGDFREFIPEGGGRATSFGLLRYSTQISGSTLFLGDPAILPLRDLPIFGSIKADLPHEQWTTITQLLEKSPNGGGVQILLQKLGATEVRDLGCRIAESLRSVGFPSSKPLVILVQGNVGKALGHYITQWGASPLTLVVIDEITAPNAQFVHIGRLHDRVVPVSFYGLQG
jgi:ethanolamine utilization protein EutA